MKHLGDITQIHGDRIEPVDVITFGSPCQDLSVAGKREGLAGERSGLFSEAVRIIKEMREATDGIYPNFAVWENVPGALSSNGGDDFREVLEELARAAEPGAVIPRPAGKWRTSGCVMGDGWSIAWRILDAQFWGVPQRRRRIALVVDFAGGRAPEILFIRKGLQGDSYPGGEAQKKAALHIGRGFALPGRRRGVSGGDRGGEVKDIIPFQCNQRDEMRELNDVSGTLAANPGMKQQTFVAISYCLQGNVVDRDARQNGTGVIKDLSYTLNATDRHAVCASFMAGQGAKAGGIAYTKDGSPTLKGAGSGTNQVPCVVFDARWNGDGSVSPTMTGDHQNRVTDYTAVVCMANEQPIVAGVDCRNMRESEEIFPTLQSKNQGGYDLNRIHAVRVRYRVRRLTPLECERLQGFPDGWTDIPDTAINGNSVKTSDSSRYRALGNSIAIPPFKWVLKRVSAQFEWDAALGSLFDGIGGFPYIWEQFNGKGSARWASEIEPFCIAVTQYRFGLDHDYMEVH